MLTVPVVKARWIFTPVYVHVYVRVRGSSVASLTWCQPPCSNICKVGTVLALWRLWSCVFLHKVTSNCIAYILIRLPCMSLLKDRQHHVSTVLTHYLPTPHTPTCLKGTHTNTGVHISQEVTVTMYRNFIVPFPHVHTHTTPHKSLVSKCGYSQATFSSLWHSQFTSYGTPILLHPSQYTHMQYCSHWLYMCHFSAHF